jgi:hypothetical protein
MLTTTTAGKKVRKKANLDDIVSGDDGSGDEVRSSSLLSLHASASSEADPRVAVLFAGGRVGRRPWLARRGRRL